MGHADELPENDLLIYWNSGFAHPENRHVSPSPWQVYSLHLCEFVRKPSYSWRLIRSLASQGDLESPLYFSPTCCCWLWTRSVPFHCRIVCTFYRSCRNQFTRDSAMCISETFWFKKRPRRFPCIGAISATKFRLVHLYAPKFGQQPHIGNQVTGHSAMCIDETFDSNKRSWRFFCVGTISAMNLPSLCSVYKTVSWLTLRW